MLKDSSFQDVPPLPGLKSNKRPKQKEKKRKRIRCPACGWQPDGQPYWQCELCFATFDTFKTRARCPTPPCGNSWKLTQCIRCGILSPHEAWYGDREK